MRRTAVQVRAGDRFGPYHLVRLLAVGGMAEIYLAKASGISGFEKYVALKVIHPNFAEDEHFIEMLIEEAKIAVHLTQPNIVQIFDLGRIGDVHYIAMEYVDGPDLYHIMRTITVAQESVGFDVAAYIALETCAALDYAHRCTDQLGHPLGIIHRDISPQNIIVSRAGEVKLADFGIAKATVRARQTAVGVIKGKYYYMSPEQAWGDRVDQRTDLFSAGVVLYEIIVGQMLYLEEDLGLLLDRVRKADIAPPSSLRPGVPIELERIVMKAVAREPEDRFQSAYDFQVALTQFLFGYAPDFTVQRIRSLVERAVWLDEQQRIADASADDSLAGTAQLGPNALMSVQDYVPLTTHSLLSAEQAREGLATSPAPGPMEMGQGVASYDAFDEEDHTMISDQPPVMRAHLELKPPTSLPVIASASGIGTNEWDDSEEPTAVLPGARGLEAVRPPLPSAEPFALPPLPLGIGVAPGGFRPTKPSEELTRPLGPMDPLRPAAGSGQVHGAIHPTPAAPAPPHWPQPSYQPGVPYPPGPAPQPEPVSPYAAAPFSGPQAVPSLPPPQYQVPFEAAHDPGFDDDEVERMMNRSRSQRHLILVGVLICVVLIGVAVFIITARTATSSPGSVLVKTNPTRAKVYYRGKYVGDTPHRLDSLPLDEVHWVRLELERCESKAVKLEVEAGKSRTIHVTLENCDKP